MTLYRRKNTLLGSAVRLVSFDYDRARDEYVLDVAWMDVSDPRRPVELGIREDLRLPLKVWQNDWERIQAPDS